MKKKIVLDIKVRYHILSAILVGMLFWFSLSEGFSRVISASIALFVSSIGLLIVQFGALSKHSVKKLLLKTAISVITLPSAITIGTLLSLHYFPNLSIYVKSGAIIVVGGLFYVSFLVNNIFMAVQERGEVIPLFRVASTWSQILVVVVAIPLFAGIYKLPLLPFIQSGIVGITAALFSLFLNWVNNMDPDIPAISDMNRLLESAFIGFILGGLGLSISFIPTESFLRALLMSSMLMYGLGYMQAHHKNAVTRKLLVEYSIISMVFLILLLIFKQI